jgi:hypothetical protein
MISDNIIKEGFIVDVLKRDLSNIYRAQLGIAKQNIYIEGKELKKKKRPGETLKVRTGRLLASLENPDFVIQATGQEFIVSAKIMKYMRFLDMKRLGNWKIYNRQVWGILHNNSYRDIKYRYGEEIADYVREALEQALGSPHGKSPDSGGKVKDYGSAKGRGKD